MFAITRSLIRAPILCQTLIKTHCAAASSKVSMKLVPVAVEKLESYEDRNTRLGRPMSPHLSIYKPQLTWVVSITNRATGIAGCSYVWALGLGALALPQDVSHYVTMIEGLQLSATTLIILKSLLVFPLAYHTCGGVRHLLWDSGNFLKLKDVYSTGYAAIASSILLSVGLAML